MSDNNDIELKEKTEEENKGMLDEGGDSKEAEVGDEDCCDKPCCLCAPYKDESYFTNPLCMALRTSDIWRIVLGATLGFILGACLGLIRPVLPTDETRICALDNALDDAQSLFIALDSSDGLCSNFGILNKQIEAQHITALQKEIPICLDSYSISYDTDNCGDIYKISTVSSGNGMLCYGVADDGTPLITKEDELGCKNFKLLEAGLNVTGTATTEIYLDAWKDLDDEGPWSLQMSWANLSKGVSRCDSTLAGCAGNTDYSVNVYQEPDLTWKKTQEEYNEFKRTIKYVFTFPGKLWLSGLKLIVVPLLVANVITAVAALKDMPSAGKLGCATFFYYLLTTIMAAIESLVLCAIFLVPFLEQLDNNETYKKPSRSYDNTGQQIKSVIYSIVPVNGIAALIENNFLGVICFSIIAGVAMTNSKDSTFLKWFIELNDMMMTIIQVLVDITPLGVFLLVAAALASHDIVRVLSQVSLFLITIFVGLFIHCFAVYPTIYFVVTHKNPFVYWKNILPAAITALAISSSIATLPTTMRCAIEKNKISPNVAKFVLSIGATINMDGTTIGFPIAVVFVAMGEGMTLSFGAMLMIVVLSTVSSMGAAPVPQAGLVLLIVILENLDINMGSSFALIVMVDWLYDRPETMTNIVGDSFAAGVIDHLFKTYNVQSTAEEIKAQGDVIRKISVSRSTSKNEATQEAINPSEA